ncbi:hydrolase [Pararhodospirillum oryzae]|uniref:Hydrolase n=1 Tax=Pararhodospirillum oryzae TaxID=478448 RepID=A0A512H8U9_9PROT|nr:hydrolase [Pararhodospirillum oryzae]GEO81862.1 hydrolase [Pararhodospirillum oryzae]
MSSSFPSLLSAEHDVLLVIDVQERLCPVMDDPRRVLYNGSRLVRAARAMNVPIVVTEQYSKGLGPTMHDLRVDLPEDAILEKTHFSAAREPVVQARLDALGRRRAVLCGIEMHVCVTQTALGLKDMGWDVFVVEEACSSRHPDSIKIARERLTTQGVPLLSVEMVLFEWLTNKENPAFKEIMTTLIR